MVYQPSSKEEEEFLKKYDPTKYKNPGVATDGAIFARDKNIIKVLLIKRGNFPYKGALSIPGGFVEIDEDLADAVKREIREETDIGGIVFEQVGAFGRPDRDPRYRVITILFAAMVNFGDVAAKAGDDAAEAEWYTIEDYKSETSYANGKNERTVSMTLSGNLTLKPRIKINEDTKYVEILNNGNLAFDHAHEIIAAYEFIMK